MRVAIYILSFTAILLAIKNMKSIKEKAAVIPVSFLPFHFHALTIPPFGIFILKDQQSNQNLIEHEQMHWQQYQQMGLLAYHTQYLKELIQFGYDKMPMEITARFVENDFCKENYTECVRNGSARTITDKLFRA